MHCFVLLDSLININLIDLSYFTSIFFLLLENPIELTHFLNIDGIEMVFIVQVGNTSPKLAVLVFGHSDAACSFLV